ncbi:TIR domain-containing protein [Caldimonas sp. KR1-144]|uniref:TIR domain-containing protein n=1 Tax=Caldimonas sp. KR1-144 TaxID=3400911 RepID=UPI003C129927
MSADAHSVSSPPAAPARRYGAFLSYSHRDAALATWLQRGLETYRLPPRLAGRETAVGPVPRTVGPVFRDRDELPAGADLATHVREGLAASRWLIVVCSPAAAASPWVEREILEFKRLHGEERVLAVIAAGEPYASRRPGREQEECFPQALRHARAADGTPTGAELEPIAVDLRKQGDGKRMALLKLIAGMTGVGVDELAQRDAQRRARRLAWLAVGATVGMLVMGVMAVMALQARNEAREQRAQAEDLIEFMLGDLRKKLEPVGRLEVLDAVGEKALGYYDRQDAAKLDATSLGHRSRAMHLIGEIRDLRGQRDQALEAFRSAAETTAQLLKRFPNDPQRIFDHAQSVFWVGYMVWRRGDAMAAEQAFGEYLALARRLVSIDPAKHEWQLEVAMAATNLGIVQSDTGRMTGALALFDESRRIYEPIVKAKPMLGFELAQTWGWMAQAHERLGDYERASGAQRAKLPLYDAIPGADKDRRVLQGRLNVATLLSRYALTLGRWHEAESHGREALMRASELVDADPSNLLWRRDRCYARLDLAAALLANGRTTDARSTLAPMGNELPRLLAADPADLDVAVNLRGRWLSLAARSALLTPQAAIDALRTLLADVDELAGRGARVSLVSGPVPAARAELGRLLSEAGELAEARALWRRTLDQLPVHEGASSRSGAERGLILRAQLLRRLGHDEAARPLVEQLRTSSVRSPDARELLAGGPPAAGMPGPAPSIPSHTRANRSTR